MAERHQQHPSPKRKRSYAGTSTLPSPATESPRVSPPNTSRPELSNISWQGRPGYKPPGRLGDPRLELYQEPRLHPRLLETLSQYGLDRNRPPRSLAILSVSSTRQELEASMADAEIGFENLYETLPNDLPNDSLELETERRVESIMGPDNNFVQLYIYRPILKGGALPCIVYCHGGGGMVITRADNKVQGRWCTSLAAQGMMVVNVGYRNACGATSGYHPFPAGLNDVCAAVQYIHRHRADLNIRNTVLHGDGGGANLALATAIEANREGWTYKINGVYACSPQISNAYHWTESRKLTELPSLVECHGYIRNVDFMAYMAHVYTPSSWDGTNPLAWPYHASEEDLEGLPPHVLSMDELDPLRSEGENYVRKLVQAGVRAVGHVNVGMVHSAAMVFRQAVPDMHREAVRGIAAFAKQC